MWTKWWHLYITKWQSVPQGNTHKYCIEFGEKHNIPVTIKLGLGEWPVDIAWTEIDKNYRPEVTSAFHTWTYIGLQTIFFTQLEEIWNKSI